MAVRVRLRIRVGGKLLESAALVNTGFETEGPQVLLPVKAAERLGLWPGLPREARVEVYDTAGGPVRVYVLPRAARVSIVAGDRVSREVESDVVISHTEVEILVSDKLAGELGVAIEDPGRGLWRLRDDPPGTALQGERGPHGKALALPGA